MNVMDSRMHPVERAVFTLRELYEQYGYKKYKMSKFEEYDLYLENKSFLPSGQIITFSDLGGRLLALKPDVTLSIAKNVPAEMTEPEKVYYNENVYRTPRGGNECREISQVGLECLGRLDTYRQCEVITLAYRSLKSLDEGFVITLSHMGFVSGLLEESRLSLSMREEILSMVEQKNAHELARVCDSAGLDGSKRDALLALTGLYGPYEQTLKRAQALACNSKMELAVSELRELFAALPAALDKSLFQLDFGVINDLSYYNGLIFQGYIPGVPRAILSGGRYDNLMEKLGKNAQAIGFAVYVDELERLEKADETYDVDVLLLYDEQADAGKIVQAVEGLRACGLSVRAQSSFTEKLRYKQLQRLTESGAQIIERND